MYVARIKDIQVETLKTFFDLKNIYYELSL